MKVFQSLPATTLSMQWREVQLPAIARLADGSDNVIALKSVRRDEVAGDPRLAVFPVYLPCFLHPQKHFLCGLLFSQV